MQNFCKFQNEYEILTPDGFKDFSGIQKLTKKLYFKLILDDDSTLLGSEKHKIDTKKGYVYLKDLCLNDEIQTKSGIKKIKSIEKVEEEIELYDLINVDDNRNRFFANDIVVSNCSFIPGNIWDNFYSSSYPTISSGKKSKIIFVSTPNGLNHFYKFWRESELGINEFANFRVDWWQVPGRDESWKEETIKNIGIKKFSQEFGNSFLGSASTLIEPQMISNFSHSIPLTEIPEQFQKFQTSVSFFELPKEDHIYALGIDMARMTEKNSGDPMAIQILDITKLPYIQVCRFWIKENINYLRIPEIAVSLGNFYNKALIFIENNDIGLEIGNMIHFEYEYESMYFEKDLPGFRTTPKTKRLGCVNLKSLIESNKLILNDFDTISELSTFIQKGKSFQAEHGKSDDLIMALIASIFFVQCPNLDLFDSRRSFYEQVLKTNDETPFFGIIDDGVNVYDDRNIF